MKRGKKRNNNVLMWLLLLVGMTMFLVSGFYIYKNMTEYRIGEEEYEELNEVVQEYIRRTESVEHTNQAQRPEEPSDSDVSESPEANASEEWAPQLAVCEAVRDLKKENEDVIGWLMFDKKAISYPVMHGRDDDQYLHTTYKGVSNSAGSIFIETLNHEDFQDSHTIVYGHNMKNGSMFGTLKEYRNEGHYEENPYFTIYTPDKAYRYQIFAYYTVSELDDNIYDVHFDTTDEFADTLDYMKRKSYIKTDVEVGVYDKVVTLSTCSTTGNRFVVSAVRIGEYDAGQPSGQP